MTDEEFGALGEEQDGSFAASPSPSATPRIAEALDAFLAATDDYAWNEHDLKLLRAIEDLRGALSERDEVS